MEKLELKCNSIKKDSERSRENLIDLVNKNIISLIREKNNPIEIQKG